MHSRAFVAIEVTEISGKMNVPCACVNESKDIRANYVSSWLLLNRNAQRGGNTRFCHNFSKQINVNGLTPEFYIYMYYKYHQERKYKMSTLTISTCGSNAVVADLRIEYS